MCSSCRPPTLLQVRQHQVGPKSQEQQDNPQSDGQAEVSPEIVAVMEGLPPLYGTCTIFIPAIEMSWAIIKCPPLPLPADPYKIWSGRFLASAINSPTDFTGIDGCTINMPTCLMSMLTPMKSLSVS